MELLTKVTLVWRPHHMDFHTCVSQTMTNCTRKVSESQNDMNVTN